MAKPAKRVLVRQDNPTEQAVGNLFLGHLTEDMEYTDEAPTEQGVNSGKCLSEVDRGGRRGNPRSPERASFGAFASNWVRVVRMWATCGATESRCHLTARSELGSSTLLEHRGVEIAHNRPRNATWMRRWVGSLGSLWNLHVGLSRHLHGVVWTWSVDKYQISGTAK